MKRNKTLMYDCHVAFAVPRRWTVTVFSVFIHLSKTTFWSAPIPRTPGIVRGALHTFILIQREVFFSGENCQTWRTPTRTRREHAAWETPPRVQDCTLEPWRTIQPTTLLPCSLCKAFACSTENLNGGNVNIKGCPVYLLSMLFFLGFEELENTSVAKTNEKRFQTWPVWVQTKISD